MSKSIREVWNIARRDAAGKLKHGGDIYVTFPSLPASDKASESMLKQDPTIDHIQRRPCGPLPAEMLKALQLTGFVPCEYGPDDDPCEICGVSQRQLYFGNQTAFDAREGDLWCGHCLLAFAEKLEDDFES